MFLRWDTAVGDVRHFCECHEGATIVLTANPRFYGVTCAQVLFYVSEYSTDRWWMKSIVSVYAFPALCVLILIKVALLLYTLCSVRRISSAEGFKNSVLDTATTMADLDVCNCLENLAYCTDNFGRSYGDIP